MRDVNLQTSWRDRLPGLNVTSAITGEYFLRLAIIAIVLQEGLQKFPNLEAGAAMYQLPVELWTMAAVAEVVGPIAIAIGGLFRSEIGDLMTRVGGFLIAGVVGAVIVHVSMGPWLGMRFHVLMLAVGVFFMLRGNGMRLRHIWCRRISR
ncbi:MAG: DoxX family protein [Pseudomonadota bacterium]